MILEQVQQRPRLLVGQVERHHASRSVEILARLERTIGSAAPGDVAVTGGRLICAAASVPVSDSTEGKWHRLLSSHTSSKRQLLKTLLTSKLMTYIDEPI